MYSSYKNILCYVTSDNKLISSTMKNNIFESSNIDISIDIIKSIVRLLVTPKNIILHTNNDDVYIYNIDGIDLKYFGKYFIVNMNWYIKKNNFFLVFVTNTSIILFDEKVTKISEFNTPENECPEKIGQFVSSMDYFVQTNTKTYILDENLNLVVALDQKYTVFVTIKNIYYCLTDTGDIHLRDNNWNHITTISFAKITSFRYNGILMFIDGDKKLYHLQKKINPFNADHSTIVHEFFIGDKKRYIMEYPVLHKFQHPPFENNFKEIVDNCCHVDKNNCSCDPKYCVMVFNNEIHIHDRREFTAVHMKDMEFKIENILDYENFGDEFMLFIDDHGKIYIYQITSKMLKFYDIHNIPKIKMIKKINTKNARF